MLEGLRGYVQLATGLTEVTASKAKDAAMSLVQQGLSAPGKTPDVVGSVQDIADDLVTTSKQNRELLVGLIRTEVDRAVGRMGFVREDELAALRTRLEHLEAQVRADEQAAGKSTSSQQPNKKSTQSSESTGSATKKSSVSTETNEKKATAAPKAKKKVVPE
jgi:polyhydroxyalkanoate synthesis regulator phasin